MNITEIHNIVDYGGRDILEGKATALSQLGLYRDMQLSSDRSYQYMSVDTLIPCILSSPSKYVIIDDAVPYFDFNDSQSKPLEFLPML